MPATIFAMPDSPDPTATPVQGHGWVDGASAQIAMNGRLTRRCRRILVAIPAGLITAAWVALVPCVLAVGAGTTQAMALTLFTACALVFTYCVGLNAGHAHGSVWGVRRYTEHLADTVRTYRERRMLINLPRRPHGEGYLYVVEFSTGTVKVGQSEDPKVRLPTHRREAEAFGVHVVNYWVSPAHLNFHDNETRLINRCMEVSHRSRKEYFHAVGYVQAVGFANALTYYSESLDQVSTEGVWA